MSAFVGYTGRLTLNGLHATLTVCVLMVDTLYWATVAPLRGQGFRLKNAVSQFVEFGAHSLPIVMLICFLIGAIMAMQSSYQLARFGAVHLVANLVGIAAMREFAPLMTAIIITGRSGSAITAEIGTMKVAEEIDALEVMGLNVTKFLVVPKFIGMLLAVPMVTLIAIATMIFGGFLTSAVVIGLDVSSYIAQTADALSDDARVLLEDNAPVIEDIIVDIREVMRNMKDFTRTLADEPQSVIRGKTPTGRR